jgi:hypothetical protein
MHSVATKAGTKIAWLTSRKVVALVARHLGCTPDDAELQIIEKGKAGLIRARGMTEGRPVSPLRAAWHEATDLAGTTMRPPGASCEITNLELCFIDLVAAGLLPAPTLGRARWSAAEALAWIITGVPLRLKEWAGLPELGDGMEQAGIDLARAISEDHVLAWGSLDPLGPMKRMPSSDLRIPGFVWVIRPDGTLGTSPPGRLAVFLIAQYEQGLKEERCWYRIEVDSATVAPLRVERRMLDEAEQFYAGSEPTARAEESKAESVKPMPATTEESPAAKSAKPVPVKAQQKAQEAKRKAQRKVERNSRIAAAAAWAKNKSNLNYAEVRESQPGKVDPYTECKATVSGLTYNEFRDGLKIERNRRRVEAKATARKS